MKHQATHTLFFSQELPQELRLDSGWGHYIYVESQYNQEANSVITENIDESLPLAKYPVCAWSAAAYTNWLTQNAINNVTTKRRFSL